MRVLITGATGFLGRHLTQRLLADGLPVRVLARSPAKAEPLIAQGAELVTGDITDDTALRRGLADVTVVYHLAGRLFIPGEPAATYYRTHVTGTRLLLARCHQHTGLVRFIYCSTTGVLGVTGDYPADETAPYRPTNIYEQTKLEAELLVREASQGGFPAVIVRPGLVYGPGDLHLLGFFQAIQRRLFRPIGHQPVWLHPIYIDDMTAALVHCGRHPRAVGECLHIAGRQPVTLAALAATIASTLGVAPPRGWIPLPVAWALATITDLLPGGVRQHAPLTRSRLDFLTHSRVYDVTKAQRLLGFVAATDLAEGIARTVAWYRAEGYLPKYRNRSFGLLSTGWKERVAVESKRQRGVEE